MCEMGRILLTAVLVCCLWTFARASYNGVCYYHEKVTKYVQITAMAPPYRNGVYFGNRIIYTTRPIDAYNQVPYCCAGYHVTRNVPLRCEPTCEPWCVNADCVTPNNCVCWAGYRTSGINACSPMCRYGCNNGKCIAPNTCQCNSGFTKDALDRCVKICQLGCQNGVCVNGECVCNSGYKQVTPYKCSKECKCENGRCTPEGICECYEGYVRYSSSRCVPHCSKGCKNGQCIAPNTCECATGFEHDKNGECVPRCSPVCTNGVCQPLNKCVCNPGYTMTGTRICDPECSNCTNGFCFDLGTKCTPECTQMCINGKCTAPNICTCDSGYEKDPADETNSRCIPRYEDRCRYGQYSGQKTCTCDKGYVLDPTSRVCVPRCSNNCTHGTCAENGTCSCEEGWTGTSCDTRDLCWKCNSKNTRRCTPNTEGCDCQVDSSAQPCADRCRLHGDQFQPSCSHLANCSCLRKECFDSEGVCYCSPGAVNCESLSRATASLEKHDSTNLGKTGIILLTLMILVLIVVPVLEYIRSHYDLRKRKRNMDNENYYDDASNQVIESTMVENELYDVTLNDSETDTYDQIQYQEKLP